MSSRIELFHIVFSQFTVLQIIKSAQQVKSVSCAILLTLLVISCLWIQFLHGAKSRKPPILMYCAFIALSVIDGSLSNHVVSSSSLALLILACIRTSHVLWEIEARRAVIWFTAILYLVTGIHKLNDGFFDVHHSCASLYLSGSLTWFPRSVLGSPTTHAVVSSLIRFAPICAVVFELGMPIVLILSTVWDTKNLILIRSALFVGATFHAVLALPPSPLSVYPFSSIMVPIYLLMVPRECAGIEKFVNWFTRTKVAVFVVLLGILSNNVTEILFGEEELFEYPNYGLWAISVIWNTIAWAVIMFSLVSINTEFQMGKRVNTRPGAYLVVLGLLLFGLTPYIGLRNYPALAMFSNLRTEGKNPNHWVPACDLFGYQNDYVDVLWTNIPDIRDMQIDLGQLFPEKLKETNTLFGLSNEFYICPPKWPYENSSITNPKFSVPFIELRRRLSRLRDNLEKESFVDYVRHRPGFDETHVILRGSDTSRDSEDFVPLSWFEEIFVKFRTFSNSYSPCRH